MIKLKYLIIFLILIFYIDTSSAIPITNDTFVVNDCGAEKDTIEYIINTDILNIENSTCLPENSESFILIELNNTFNQTLHIYRDDINIAINDLNVYSVNSFDFKTVTYNIKPTKITYIGTYQCTGTSWCNFTINNLDSKYIQINATTIDTVGLMIFRSSRTLLGGNQPYTNETLLTSPIITTNLSSSKIAFNSVCSQNSTTYASILSIFSLGIMILAFGIIITQIKSGQVNPTIMLSGIFVGIIAFVMLLIGNYLVFAIMSSTGC